MGNLLQTAKQVLIDGAIELYEMRRSDLDFDVLSYENHYRNLGSLIFQIDSYNSLGDILMIWKMIIFRNWDISELMSF